MLLTEIGEGKLKTIFFKIKIQIATKAKGSRVDNRAGEPFPKPAESWSQKRREGEGTLAPSSSEQAGVSS